MSVGINRRTNHAKSMLHGDLRSKFSEGQGMATKRQHPTEGNGKNHTTDNGTRPSGESNPGTNVL